MQMLPQALLAHPTRTLVASFLGWKSLLLLIAGASPGPGYDTSASLNLPRHSKTLLLYVLERLTSWDAIYYTKVASRGYLYEQEWAFGWGFTRTIALFTAALEKIGLPHFDGIEGLAAVFIAHLSHLLSVLVLFQLTLALFPRHSRTFAFVSASLHIISPAGLFLSAPYAESSCALLSFAGTLAFSKSSAARGPLKHFLILLSGLSFGIATTFRSNGILSGFLLLEQAVRLLMGFLKGLETRNMLSLVSTGVAGMLVGAGSVLPQYIAYAEYCGADTLARPWCQRTLPSIYVFVQDHYWNNGLFRYWTLSNLPLFVLGAPMFTIMFTSAIWALGSGSEVANSSRQVTVQKDVDHTTTEMQQIVYNLAMQQFLLALYTITTAHVQIISRISSAFPVWLWYCAHLLHSKDTWFVSNFVRFMVIYAVIQAGLYASFLPPA